MNRQQIELFTKDASHYGKNNAQILIKFMTYAQVSSDPLNIFRYMEQQAICTFLPSFWLLKADLLATMGDYSSCFQCLELAGSRNGICDDESEKVINLEAKYKELLHKMQQQMKKYPLKSKRSVEEFNLLTNRNEQEGNLKDVSKLKKLIKIYDQSYQTLKKQKQAEMTHKRQLFERSWLYDIYEKQALEQTKIIQKIREHSMEGDILDYHSLYTPPKKSHQHKLTKTVDSVEIQKRKKKYQQSKLKGKEEEVEKQDDEKQKNYDLEESQTNCIVNSMPVGRHFFLLKRRVTFGAQDSEQIHQHAEKINKNLNHLSFHKNSQNSRNSSIKLRNSKSSSHLLNDRE